MSKDLDLPLFHLEISDELLQSLEKRAEKEGMEVNQLVETAIAEFLVNTPEEDEEEGLPLDELLESIRQVEAAGPSRPLVTHDQIKENAARLIAKYRAKEQQAG